MKFPNPCSATEGSPIRRLGVVTHATATILASTNANSNGIGNPPVPRYWRKYPGVAGGLATAVLMGQENDVTKGTCFTIRATSPSGCTRTTCVVIC
jgi:hypothetical protein